jgi:hypothetical protein
MQVTFEDYVPYLQRTAYIRLHDRLRKRFGSARAQLCEGGCQGRADEWANVHGTSSYVTLCTPCHARYDFPPDRCPGRHDVAHYGRGVAGCKVCDRIRHAMRRGGIVCQTCGYAFMHCRCADA